MVNTEYTRAWIDRYLRNELTAEDETRFENALLESSRLQDDLESALAVRRMLELEAVVDPDAKPAPRERPVRADDPEYPEFSTPWMPVAITGSLILAVLSGVMYWNVSHEMASLRNGIEELGRSHSHEEVVPLDIMRSASQDVPEAIINKPRGGAFVVLDIELTAAAADADRLHMALLDSEGARVATWVAEQDDSGRARASFDPAFLPEGRVWLEMSDASGQLLDRRLIEFR